MNYAAVGRLPQPLCVAQQHPNLVYGSMRRKHWYLNQTRVSHTSVRWRALDLVRGKGLPALICLPSPFGRAGRLDWTAVFAAPPGEGEGGGLGESLVRTPSSGEVCTVLARTSISSSSASGHIWAKRRGVWTSSAMCCLRQGRANSSTAQLGKAPDDLSAWRASNVGVCGSLADGYPVLRHLGESCCR